MKMKSCTLLDIFAHLFGTLDIPSRSYRLEPDIRLDASPQNGPVIRTMDRRLWACKLTMLILWATATKSASLATAS
jgi:hypothetical protein